jgi:succinate-semialdehyde dehydrogenase/glutarate-semialdehyde dehydrogenase
MPFISQDPSTETIWAHTPKWSDEQIESTLILSQKAQKVWAKSPLAERNQILLTLATLLRSRAPILSDLMSQEMGKLRHEGNAEVNKCADLCDYLAHTSQQNLAPIPLTLKNHKATGIREPLGLTLGIMPWNFPIWQVLRYAAPSLVAGNGALIKPAPTVLQTSLYLQQLMVEAGLSPHLCPILPIDETQIAKLIAHPWIRSISITGSERAGRIVASLAGQQLKKTILELGGSDPFLVLDDASTELAAKAAVQSRYLNAGQTCIAAKRFIITPKQHQVFTEALLEQVQQLKLGPAKDPTSTLAPMARNDLRNHLHHQVTRAQNHSNTILCGGVKPNNPGWYYPATILTNVTPESPLWNEEVFGPVAQLCYAQSESEAIDWANHSPFGLGASLWTNDITKAQELAQQIEAGCVFINSLVRSDPAIPFGGTKNSGYGYELGTLGLWELTHLKSICLSD